MITWHVGTRVEVERHEPQKDEIVRVRIGYYEGTKSGTNENPVDFVIEKDGAVFFSGEGDGAFIYLYPRQTREVMKLLERHLVGEKGGTRNRKQ